MCKSWRVCPNLLGNLEIPTEAAFLTKKNKTFNANYHNKTEKYLCILVLGKSKSSLFTYFTCRGTTKVKWPENTDTSPCKMKLCYAFVMVRNVLLKTNTLFQYDGFISWRLAVHKTEEKTITLNTQARFFQEIFIMRGAKCTIKYR